MMPLAGEGQVNSVAPEGSALPRSEQPSANFRMVAPEFFRTLGIQVLRGRTFTSDDRAADRPFPALVSEPTAQRLWPGQNPLGRRFDRGIPGERGFEVVGIVADAHTTSLDRTPPLMVYVPYWWRSRPSVPLLVRTISDPAAIMTGVRRAILEIDPEIAIGEPRQVEQLVEASVAGRRYQMELFVAFGAIAVFIAIVGVYAVTAYGVSRRRREINIRVALGAQRARVMTMMLRQGIAPILVGAAAGAAAAVAVGGVVASLLFEVRPGDPFVIGGVVTLVTGSAVGSCFIAARRALAIDPAAALREE
jgi:predicted permease